MDLDATLSALTMLPVAERLRVVTSLWNSIEADASLENSTEQDAELNRRILRHEQHPEELLSWQQVLDRLRGQP